MARRSRKERREKRRGRSALLDIIAAILPLVSLAGSLAVAVVMFSRVNHSVSAAQERLAGTTTQATTTTEPVATYTGVEDPWIREGTFTVGNEELDRAIKNLCDQNTKSGSTVADAAQATYNTIVESTYVDQLEKPSGIDWVSRSARQYFSYLKEDGGTPQGDYYEFASVAALCLRYFGYSDAIAVPVVHAMQGGGQYGSALCVVTNLDGVASVCDPALGTGGWMLKRSSYDILVDDIGQNLEAARSMGLEVQEKQQQTVNVNGYNNGMMGDGTMDDGTSYGGESSGRVAVDAYGQTYDPVYGYTV